jgi:hypothetical protein
VYFLFHCSALAGDAAARATAAMHNSRVAVAARPVRCFRFLISESASNLKLGCREQLVSMCIPSTLGIRNEGRAEKVPWFLALL